MKQISVDISSKCPCRCRYCSPHIDTAAGELMSDETFSAIVKTLVTEKYNFVYLYAFGEPFTHPRIYEYIALLRANKITSDVATKLSVQYDWNKMETMYPDRMLVTLDSLNHDILRKIAPGINPDLVFKNLNALARFRRSHPNVHLVFNSTVCSVNYGELPAIAAFLKEKFAMPDLPVHYSGKAMGIGFGCTTEATRAYAVAAAGDLSTDQFTECRFKIVDGKIVPLYDKRCWPNGKECLAIPVIDRYGRLTPCCHDAFSSIVLGDVLKEGSIDRILATPASKRIIAQAKELKLPICEYCN